MRILRIAVTGLFSALLGAGAGVPALAQSQGINLRLSAVVSGHDVPFGHIGAITAGPDGRIYVLDTEPNYLGIYVVNPDGEQLARLGRPGEGPGEFTSLRHTLAWRGDTLLAFDLRSRRLTGFKPDGEVALTRSWNADIRAVPDRLLASQDHVYGISNLSYSRGVLRYTRIALQDSIQVVAGWSEPLPSASQVPCATPVGEALHLLQPVLVNPVPVRAVTPEGDLLRASRDAYRIEYVDQEGEVVRTIERDVPRIEFRREDWVRTPEGAWARFYEREGGGSMLDPSDRTAPCPWYDGFPASAPVIQSVTVDENGRVWVEGADPETETGFSLSVFNSSGELLGETPMPERDGRVAPYVRQDRLYIAAVDELGVQSIQIYDLIVGDDSPQ